MAAPCGGLKATLGTGLVCAAVQQGKTMHRGKTVAGMTGLCRVVGGDLERDKMDVDKFGSPTSYQLFPSILGMRCAIQSPPGNNSIHPEATRP